MPIIPLPQQSNPLPNVPKPVLDREKRPTVDNSGVIKAVGAFADATKMPELPMSLADNSGLQAIGKALGQAGNVMGALAIKRQEAETYNQTVKAKADMDVALENARAFQEQHKYEPGLWSENWEKSSATTLETILANPKLTPQAREQIQMYGDSWMRTHAGRINSAGASREFDIARENIEGEIGVGIATQKREVMDEAIAKGKQAGWLFDWKEKHYNEQFTKEGERQQKQAKADAYNAAENNAITLASANGAQAAEAELDRGTLGKHEPADTERLRGVIRQTARSRETELADSLTAGIFTEGIKSEADVDAIQSPHLRPELREKAKAWLRDWSDGNKRQAEKQDREENWAKNFADLFTKVEAFDRTKYKSESDAQIAAVELRMEMRRRVGDKDDGFLSQWLWKKSNAAPQNGFGKETEDVLNDGIKVLFDGKTGMLPWMEEVPKLDDKGRPMKDEMGNVKKEWVGDSEKQLDAIVAIAKVKQVMGEWAKANPQDANNPVKVREALRNALPEGSRLKAIDVMQKKTAPQASVNGSQVTSYGYANDSTPDSNSRAGIGAWAPDAEAEKIKRGEDSPYKLKEGDIAVSPDVEKAFRASGVKPGDEVLVQLASGEVRRARWMDRTAQDEDVLAGKIKGVTKPLRGRFDFYSPKGRDARDGMKVVKWWVPDEMPSIPSKVAQS